MDKKKQKRIYKSLAEVEKEFIPILYKERLERHQTHEPKDIGSKIAKDIIEHAKNQLLS